MRLGGKTALITGGARGIGRCIAEMFAREGAQVAICDRLGDQGRETAEAIQAEGGQSLFVLADVSDSAQVQGFVNTALQQYGKIDILVNNAARTWDDGDLHEINETQWKAHWEGTLSATFHCCKAVLPIMMERGGGAIINISSINALLGLHYTAYSTAKAGLLGLTRILAVRYGPYNIRVNAICPGTIESEVVKEYYDARPEFREQVKQLYPLRRFGRPEDVAYCALYLASEEASFVTGAIFIVDGGLSAGHHFPLEPEEFH